MQQRFTHAFKQLPPHLSITLTPLLQNPHFHAVITAAEVDRLKNATTMNEQQLTLALLPLAAAYSLAPISQCHVGAIACGISGDLYFGANMEFPGVPIQQTLHAEQSAIVHAWLRGEEKLSFLSVNYSPCGHCRQFINELNTASQLTLYQPGQPATTLATLLPNAFGPQDLQIKTLLMDQTHHALTFQTQNTLVQMALDAANRSYAPYSHAYSGVALETQAGEIYPGRYAENAAFNPSLPPLQAALLLMHLSGADITQIHRAALVESASSVVTQKVATQALLATLGCHHLTHVIL